MNAQPRHAASGRETSCSASSGSLSTTIATTAEKWKSVCHRHSPSHVSYRLPVHVPYGLSTWRKVQLVPAVINQASGGDCAVSVVTQCSDFNSGLCHRLERLYRNRYNNSGDVSTDTLGQIWPRVTSMAVDAPPDASCSIAARWNSAHQASNSVLLFYPYSWRDNVTFNSSYFW